MSFAAWALKKNQNCNCRGSISSFFGQSSVQAATLTLTTLMYESCKKFLLVAPCLGNKPFSFVLLYWQFIVVVLLHIWIHSCVLSHHEASLLSGNDFNLGSGVAEPGGTRVGSSKRLPIDCELMKRDEAKFSHWKIYQAWEKQVSNFDNSPLLQRTKGPCSHIVLSSSSARLSSFCASVIRKS